MLQAFLLIEGWISPGNSQFPKDIGGTLRTY